MDPRIDGLKAANEWYATIYHTPSDDLTQHFDWGAGVKSAKLSFLLGYLTAQDTVRPRWNDGDFFGQTFGRGH